LTPPPVDTTRWNRHNEKLEKDPSYRHNDVAKKYGNVVKSVAAAHEDCFVVDIFDLLGANDEQQYAPHLSDGLHLSGSGNELVYTGLMNVLVEQTDKSPTRLGMDPYTNKLSIQSTRPSIVLLGDSFTEFGFDGRVGWAALLASDYSRRAHVLNRGFQGHTTREILAQLPKMLHENATDGALFVTLWLGSNDAIDDDERQVPLDEFETNLEAIVARLR
jgi:lysophospholipase L1-like esterase